MAHEHEKRPVSPESLKQGYEVGEMGFKVILVFGILISSLTILSMIMMMFFFGALEKYAPPASQYVASPLESEREALPVQQSPVEAEPVKDRLEIEQAAVQALHEFAWVSEEAGIARIPIEEAMRLIVENGIPALAPIETVIGPQTPVPPAAEAVGGVVGIETNDIDSADGADTGAAASGVEQ